MSAENIAMALCASMYGVRSMQPLHNNNALGVHVVIALQ